MFSVNVYKGVAPHIGHTGTAKHLASRIRQTFINGFSSFIGTHTDITSHNRHLGAAIHIGLVTTAIDISANSGSLGKGRNNEKLRK